MKTTITRLFDSRAQAESAIRELESMGIPEADLTLVARRGRAEDGHAFEDRDGDGVAHQDAADGAGKGAATGGLLGGGAGLLAGLGMLAIPGLGPVVAAGWLASTAVGAAVGAVAGGATGGLLGALKDAGVPDGDAHVYAEGVRRGATLVSARVDEVDVARIEAVFNGFSGVDAVSRGAVYRNEGWSAFDERAETPVENVVGSRV